MKILAAVAVASLGLGHAAVIASQDFEGNTTATGTTTTIVFPTDPGLIFDGTGLGWTVTTSGNPVVNEGGDLIGVVNSTITSATNGNGGNDHANSTGATGNYFLADDVDSTVSLTFDTVNAQNATGLSLSFSWAVESSGYESSDFFSIAVNNQIIFDVSGDDLESGVFVDNFADVVLDLSAFDNQDLNIVVGFSNSASSEDIAFDNLVISGDVIGEVPVPAAALLFIPAAFGFLRARRS